MGIIITIGNFIIRLIFISLSFILLGLSSYGLGKNEKKPASSEYKASILFFALGLLMSVTSVVFWHQGNTISKNCSDAISNFGMPYALAKKAKLATPPSS